VAGTDVLLFLFHDGYTCETVGEWLGVLTCGVSMKSSTATHDQPQSENPPPDLGRALLRMQAIRAQCLSQPHGGYCLQCHSSARGPIE
jgi:hypothetical protein